jgi:hypothetical protein
MIVLSAGMPRAGSGWYYNLTNDMVLAAGGQEARRIRQRYHLQGILTEVNCNIGALTPRRLGAVMLPSLLGNTFVIKAHAAPTPFAKSLIRIGAFRAAYIYRDPRDAMLSAMENGKRAVEKGRANAFSHLTDFDLALEFMQEYVRISEDWLQVERALHTRYESLLNDYDREAARLAAFLGLQTQDPAVQTVIARYRPESPQPDQKGLHFNQGKTGRFRLKMTPAEQEILAEKFGPYLEKMAYTIE